jgi:hypothetical protein
MRSEIGFDLVILLFRSIGRMKQSDVITELSVRIRNYNGENAFVSDVSRSKSGWRVDSTSYGWNYWSRPKLTASLKAVNPMRDVLRLLGFTHILSLHRIFVDILSALQYSMV